MPIIAMPPHIAIIGMPAVIMVIMRSQQAMNMSFMDASIGVISQVMPVDVIVQVTRHIIIGIPIMGIMPPLIIGIIPLMAGMLIGIMPFIIGIFIGIIAVIGIAFMARLRSISGTTRSVVGVAVRADTAGINSEHITLCAFVR